MSQPRQRQNSFVLFAQLSILASFLLFTVGVIAWIVHLVTLSFALNDVTDASMAISLVAIPVFLTLTGLAIYVIVGLALDPEMRELPEEEDDP